MNTQHPADSAPFCSFSPSLATSIALSISDTEISFQRVYRRLSADKGLPLAVSRTLQSKVLHILSFLNSASMAYENLPSGSADYEAQLDSLLTSLDCSKLKKDPEFYLDENYGEQCEEESDYEEKVSSCPEF